MRKSKRKKKKPTCPYGLVYGRDADIELDECSNCELYEKCFAASKKQIRKAVEEYETLPRKQKSKPKKKTKEKKEHKRKRRTLLTSLTLREKNYIPESAVLFQFMGKDYIVLKSINNHFQLFMNKLQVDGSFFISRRTWKYRYGLTHYKIQTPLKHFRILRIYEESELNAPGKVKYYIYSEIATHILAQIGFWYGKELKADYAEEKKNRKKKRKIPDKTLAERLNHLYKKILKNKELRECYRNFVKKTMVNWEIRNLEIGYYDREELRAFYDNLMEIYK